jgi:hypothetical protein
MLNYFWALLLLSLKEIWDKIEASRDRRNCERELERE